MAQYRERSPRDTSTHLTGFVVRIDGKTTCGSPSFSHTFADIIIDRPSFTSKIYIPSQQLIFFYLHFDGSFIHNFSITENTFNKNQLQMLWREKEWQYILLKLKRKAKTFLVQLRGTTKITVSIVCDHCWGKHYRRIKGKLCWEVSKDTGTLRKIQSFKIKTTYPHQFFDIKSASTKC